MIIMKKVKGFMQLALLAIMLLTAGASSSWGQTYKLVKVTSQDEIVSGGLYVFEQRGYVMSNSVTSDNGLNTLSEYESTGLGGKEKYIWTLENSNSANCYYMKNISVNKYLKNTGSGNAKVYLEASASIAWKFTKQENETFLIQNPSNENRILSYPRSDFFFYKAYTSAEEYLRSIVVYRLAPDTPEAVTVTTAGLATYVSTSALDYSNVEGLKAYKAKVNGNDVTLTRVDQVPAGEGVLLRATNTLTENTTFDIPVASTVTSWAASDNDFIPGTGESVATQNGSNYNYILNKVNGVVGFYKAAGNTVATNRAYLSTTETPGARGMVMTFDDDATSIVCLEPFDHSQETVVYDLQGRRINGDVKKGLYIVNGKKVIK